MCRAQTPCDVWVGLHVCHMTSPCDSSWLVGWQALLIAPSFSVWASFLSQISPCPCSPDTLGDFATVPCHRPPAKPGWKVLCQQDWGCEFSYKALNWKLAAQGTQEDGKSVLPGAQGSGLWFPSHLCVLSCLTFVGLSLS